MEKKDGKLLGKCMEELKRKCLESYLLKEVDEIQRAKIFNVVGKAIKKLLCFSPLFLVCLLHLLGSFSAIDLKMVIWILIFLITWRDLGSFSVDWGLQMFDF